MLTSDTPASPTPAPPGRDHSLLILFLLLFAAISVICHDAYKPHDIMWANDTQLGPLKNASSNPSLTQTFNGHWLDHWWIGQGVPINSPSFCNIYGVIVSPEFYLKTITPLSMLVLGFSVWLFFRQLKFSPMTCLVGGLIAGLNMHAFSIGTWGLPTWTITIAMVFFALAVLVTTGIRQAWVRAVLAGAAVGLCVMDGFDCGAILSVYVGVFIVFFTLVTERTAVEKVGKSILVEAIVVLFSLAMAASTINTLVGTQIVGIAGTGQTQEDKAEHWDFATQWSFPKLETLRIITPGVFGYRLQEFMTTKDKSAAYWGRVGEDPRLARLESPDPDVRANTLQSLIGNGQPQAIEAMRGEESGVRAQIMDALRHQMQLRHSGNGEYAGVVVMVFALIAVVNAFRGGSSPFTLREKWLVGFFACAGLFSLFMCWGRFFGIYAPFYFHLPYFSTIRNPIKFLHPFHLSWIALGGFGLEAFYRNYIRPPAPAPTAGPVIGAAPAPVAPLTFPPAGNWWERLTQFDKIFAVGVFSSFAVAVVAWLLYAGSKKDLVNYLVRNGFNDDLPDRLASGIASFSIHEAAWFVFFFGATLAVVIAALTGVWRGRRSAIGWAALCAIVIIDLGRSDLPWVRYFDYNQKYSENEVTKFLKDKPYEYRVVGRLDPHGAYDLAAGDPNFGAIIHWWLENDFPYNNIQSLEIDQMPRASVLENNYLGTFASQQPQSLAAFQIAPRLWKLTSTRYILATADLLAPLNSVNTNHPLFHILKRFDLESKPGVDYPQDAGDLYPDVNTNGRDALIEYDGAMPRAKLFSYWIELTNDSQILGGLADPRFNPDLGVLVSGETNRAALPPTPRAAGLEPGTVEITDYSPKDIHLKASAKTDAVLLYNDRWDDGWRAWVDGKPADLLRCNYIMRGVFLHPGEHTIELKYGRPLGTLYVTLAAMGAGLLVGLCLICSRFTGIPFGKVGEEETPSEPVSGT